MLVIENLQVRYSGSGNALRGINLSAEAGTLTAVLGANGAGKTTLLRAISGSLAANRGEVVGGRILWNGADITTAPVHKLVEAGLIHVPEARGIFGTLTVFENLKIAGFTLRKRLLKQRLEMVLEALPGLQPRLHQSGGSLSGGQQQMLAIGRALVADPKLLLLDEPSLGLAPIIAQEILDLICRINTEGCTVILVEQRASAALAVAKDGFVIENGVVALEGPAAALGNNPRVLELYLGGAPA